MNFGYKPGDNIEAGTQKAYRFWRYVFSTDLCGTAEAKLPSQQIRLLSWVSDTRWHPGQFVVGTTPDEGEQGIHGFKTENDLLFAINEIPASVMRSQRSGCDGIVIGTVEMWGIIWNHAKGYRAQFARPLSFVSSYGNRSEQALADLRAQWEVK